MSGLQKCRQTAASWLSRYDHRDMGFRPGPRRMVGNPPSYKYRRHEMKGALIERVGFLEELTDWNLYACGLSAADLYHDRIVCGRIHRRDLDIELVEANADHAGPQYLRRNATYRHSSI